MNYASRFGNNSNNPGRELNTTITNYIKDIDDNVYLNIVIDHPEPTYNKAVPNSNTPQCYLSNDDSVIAQYSVTKNDSIIDKASDYYLSVLRFTIPLDATPLFIMPIIPNTCTIPVPLGYPDLTPFIIGIKYNGNYFPINLNYVAQDYTPIVAQCKPLQNSLLQVISPYYYVYNYEVLLNMINAGITTVLTNSGLLALFPGYIAPYFYMNPSTNLISLVIPKYFTEVVAPAVAIPELYINNVLNTYLDGFNTTYNGTGNLKGNDVIFKFNTRPDNFYVPNGTTEVATTIPGIALPATPYYYRFIQEFSCLEYWTSLRRIIVSSNSLPTRNQYVPVANNSNIITNTNTNAIVSTFPIIADLMLQLDNSPGLSRSMCYYNPTAQYQLVDLISNGEIRNIDISLFWEDRDGNLYPIELSLLQQCSIKLGFFNKELYKGKPNIL